MTTLRPYPQYKPSCVEWLGDIPSHWDARRIKHVSRLNPSRSEANGLPDDELVTFVPMEKVGTDGQIDTSEQRQFGEVKSGLTYFAEGDVILAKITPCFENGKSAVANNLLGGMAFGSTEYHVLRPAGSVEAGYLYRIVSSKPFLLVGEEYMEGSAGQKRVPTDFVANIPVPIPPLDEQRAIADLLDAMDARITRFVDARRRMIALLEEQKQAIITQAVTRGLDPDVPMKPSGIDWLGDIPAHWEVKRARYLFREVDYRAPNALLPRLSMSQRHGLVPTSEIESWRMQSESAVGTKIAEQGDLVLNRLKAHLAVFATSPVTGTVSPDYTVLRPSPSTNVRFFETLFRTATYRTQFLIRTKGIVEGFWRLYTDSFYVVPAACPPLVEQHVIVEYLDETASTIACATNRHLCEIELIQEYRTRLISDVVTGNLDVRRPLSGQFE